MVREPTSQDYVSVFEKLLMTIAESMLHPWLVLAVLQSAQGQVTRRVWAVDPMPDTELAET